VHLGRRAGLPVAIKVHGSDIRGLDRFPGRRRRTAETLRRADAVIAVSRDLADQVVGLGADPARVTVVHNGVDARTFHPGPRREARRRLDLEDVAPIILFVGHLAHVKGLDYLIDACAGLARDGVAFRCYLIGKGPSEDALKQQIARQGLDDRVFLPGPRDHAELADWYRAADVLALPSRSEGYPNVLLEAQACGLPFVASRVGGIPEIAERGVGRLVPVGDVAQLAQSLRAAIAEARDRPAGGTPALRSHAQAIDELEDVLRRLPPVDPKRS
jgi:glycosyltransferase involved in cell wall biosynthesis